MLIGEINLIELIVIEGFKVFFPDFYQFIRDNRKLFLRGNAKRSAMLESGMDTVEFVKQKIDDRSKIYEDKKRLQLFELLYELFPQLKEVYKNYHHSDDSYKEWMVNKRICSAYYFDRYFSYVVQDGDISDIEFDDFISSLANEELKDSTRRFEVLFSANQQEDLMLKLKFWENSLDEKQAFNLAHIISINCDKLIITDDFRIATPFGMGAGIIADALFKISKKTRLKAIIQILKLCKSFEFAMEVEYSLSYLDSRAEVDLKFLPLEKRQIQGLLCKWFVKKVNSRNFFNLLSDGYLWKNWVFWKEINSHQFERRLVNELKKSKANVLKFIKVFIPTVTSYSSSGRSSTYKAGFSKEKYDSISKLINPLVIAELLFSFYGNQYLNEDLNEIDDRNAIEDLTIVAAFQALYRQQS